jgi:inorganic triphosphatase YgiF
MAHAVESEIKLIASPAMLETLRRHTQLAGMEQTSTLITTYFDTGCGQLRRGGATLRIRYDGKRHQQTLKLASLGGSSVRRQEWNVKVAGNFPEPSGFPVKARTALVRLLDDAPVSPFATTRIARTTRQLSFGSSVIEIAFDIGTIRAGGREEAVCELEMELIEGDLADIMALALNLPLGPELRWSVHSKAARCDALALDLQPAAAIAQPVRLSPVMDGTKGFQAIAWNCLEQLLSNYPLVIASGDAEGVHQSRVAIRRLRTACGLFGDEVDDDAAPVLRAGLKALAKGLSPARDLHVLLERVASAARDGDFDTGELQAHLGARRDAAILIAQRLLADGPSQRLLFVLAYWIENGKWLAPKDTAEGRQPLALLAAHILSRRRGRLRRLRVSLAEMPDAARHRLRIDVKKLRYAAQFFVSLFPGKATAKHRQAFAKSLDRLQDCLGELNDMAVAAQGRGALFEDLEPIVAARLSAKLEDILDQQVKSRHKLLKVARRRLAWVIGTPAWWKAG